MIPDDVHDRCRDRAFRWKALARRLWRRNRAAPSPAPRYDAVFYEGLAHMNAQARGEAFDPLTDEDPR